jgi:hypothetical protein
MLGFGSLCLSTQSVISLSLKLKQGLNALLPARVGLGALAFEYSMRDFFEPQKVDGGCSCLLEAEHRELGVQLWNTRNFA